MVLHLNLTCKTTLQLLYRTFFVALEDILSNAKLIN